MLDSLSQVIVSLTFLANLVKENKQIESHKRGKIKDILIDTWSVFIHRNSQEWTHFLIQRFTKGNVYIFKEYHNIIQGGGGGREGVNTLVLINVYTKFQQYSFWHWRGGGGSYMYDMLLKTGPIPRWETKLLNQKLNYQKWNNDRYNNIQQKTEYL